MGSAKKDNKKIRRRSGTSSAEKKKKNEDTVKEPVVEVTEPAAVSKAEAEVTEVVTPNKNSKNKKEKTPKKDEAALEADVPDHDNNNEKISKEVDSDDEENESYPKSSSASKKENPKMSREEKKKQKQDLKERVPKVDENGLSYSKLDIRRMVKRVKRGLSAVPTKEEQHQIELERRQEKNKEDKEWDAMNYDEEKDDVRTKDKAANDKAEEAEQSGGEEEKDDETEEKATAMEEDDDSDDNNGENGEAVAVKETPEVVSTEESKRPIKKKPVKKPVPEDYVCQACKNNPACGPAHWIYDCPQKKHNPGTNAKRKRERGLNRPDEKHKVFVSGLPFHISHGGVEAFFRKALYSKEDEPSKRLEKQKLVRCKIVGFADTQECRGQAYVTFTSEDMAQKALKLDGSLWPTLKTKDSGEPQKRWLKIQPVKSRVETGKLQRQKRWQERMRTQDHISAKKMPTTSTE